MKIERFSPFPAQPSAPARAPAAAWQIVPVSGLFDIVYEDRAGIWTSRTIEARELKLGPGRTLLGGIDQARGLYRGFRVDRIRRLTDHVTGERIETGILDRLFALAKPRRATRRAAALPLFEKAA
jgi:hypothetical protein